MSHDLFRYVPQIEQTGLKVHPRVMRLLLDRDRQLEDYLSNLHPGGGIKSWIALRTALSHPAIPAGGVGTLQWRDQGLPGMIQGPAFSWDPGAPSDIVVEEASFVQVNLYVALNSAQETYVVGQIRGLDWGNIEDAKPATPAYGLTTVNFSHHSSVGAGDVISAAAWHDDADDNLSVAGSAISVVQLAAL